MDEYDADTAPDQQAWLSLDEGDRIGLVSRAHAGRFPDALHTEGSSEILHASLHAMIETQVALGKPSATTRALERLTGDSLKRHAAVHAIMQVLAKHLSQLSGEGARFDQSAYERDLDALKSADALGEALRAARFREDDSGMNRSQRRAAARHNREGRKKRSKPAPSKIPPKRKG